MNTSIWRTSCGLLATTAALAGAPAAQADTIVAPRAGKVVVAGAAGKRTVALAGVRVAGALPCGSIARELRRVLRPGRSVRVVPVSGRRVLLFAGPRLLNADVLARGLGEPSALPKGRVGRLMRAAAQRAELQERGLFAFCDDEDADELEPGPSPSAPAPSAPAPSTSASPSSPTPPSTSSPAPPTTSSPPPGSPAPAPADDDLIRGEEAKAVARRLLVGQHFKSDGSTQFDNGNGSITSIDEYAFCSTRWAFRNQTITSSTAGDFDSETQEAGTWTVLEAVATRTRRQAAARLQLTRDNGEARILEVQVDADGEDIIDGRGARSEPIDCSEADGGGPAGA